MGVLANMQNIMKGVSVAPRSVGSWLASNKTELLSGIAVALTMVPTSVAFAFLAEMDPQDGLTGAWMISLAMAVLGTRPGMVYCNAGAVAAVIAPLVREKGQMSAYAYYAFNFAGIIMAVPGLLRSAYAYYAFIFAGIIMAVLGLLRVGRLLRLLPASVMVGFVNGLSIVVFMAQFRQFQNPQAVASNGDSGGAIGGGSARRLNSFDVLSAGNWIAGTELYWMLGNVAVTMVVSIMAPRIIRKVPAALFAIVASCAFEWGVTRAAAGASTNLLRDVAPISGSLPIPIWLDRAQQLPPLDGALLGAVMPTAITVAAIALIESLGMVRYVTELADSGAAKTQRTKAPPDLRREAFWLGATNSVIGVFGAQGGCSEMGLGQLNLKSGGTRWVSSALAGILTLLVLVAASPVLEIIPVAGFAGIMFAVALVSFEWSSLWLLAAAALPLSWRNAVLRRHKLKKPLSWRNAVMQRHKLKKIPCVDALIIALIPRVDALIIAVVTVITPLMDLAIAVAIGCGIAALAFAWQSADKLNFNIYTRPALPSEGSGTGSVKVYELRGLLYYAAVEKFVGAFDVLGDPPEVELCLLQAELCDYSAMQAISTLSERYSNVGKHLRIRALKPSTLRVMGKQEALLAPGLLNVTFSPQNQEEHLHAPHLDVAEHLHAPHLDIVRASGNTSDDDSDSSSSDARAAADAAAAAAAAEDAEPRIARQVSHQTPWRVDEGGRALLPLLLLLSTEHWCGSSARSCRGRVGDHVEGSKSNPVNTWRQLMRQSSSGGGDGSSGGHEGGDGGGGGDGGDDDGGGRPCASQRVRNVGRYTAATDVGSQCSEAAVAAVAEVAAVAAMAWRQQWRRRWRQRRRRRQRRAEGCVATHRDAWQGRACVGT
ncbi:sulfate transporter family-domain-containing protein [Tribonema minus]|uniref:Sulfate transporter family-domain-containing protein n=1 Tax=Tribonema minus TaxID=303371 RepID=A0A835YQ02_9STRA|nr:sulfate transporter family-domain-containing protein [Tribonema minus]